MQGKVLKLTGAIEPPLIRQHLDAAVSALNAIIEGELFEAYPSCELAFEQHKAGLALLTVIGGELASIGQEMNASRPR